MKYSRVVGSYFTATLSISLVLLLVGLVALLLLTSQRISDYLKENLQITLVLEDGLADSDILLLEKTLRVQDYIKETKYVSKEEAEEIMREKYNDNFREIFHESPFPATIDIRLESSYLAPDRLQTTVDELSLIPQVQQVMFEKSIVANVYNNLRKVGMVISVLCVIMILIAVSLINNTVRLSVYSKRFTIHTMQLVGATNMFIRRPFIVTAMIQGIYASLIASAIVFLIIKVTKEQFISINMTADSYTLILTLVGVLMISGIMLTVISTYFSVGKYLKMKFDDLFYK